MGLAPISYDAWNIFPHLKIAAPKCMLSKCNPSQLRRFPVFVYVCASAALQDTCAVGPSAVNVVIRSPLLGNLVGVNEDDHHRDQADEGHQHRCAQSRVDVWDEAPTGVGEKKETGLMT